MQLELETIEHKVEDSLIPQRASDGYVNATAMCKAAGKLIKDYGKLKATQEFLAELSSETGIPITELVISIKGGPPQLQGTWVHPQLAINLGQWCSPKFAVAVSKWVLEWMTGRLNPSGMPVHMQRYLANRSQIPPTHFSLLNEMAFNLIGPLEIAGYTLPEKLVPDISAGLMFCKWLREEKGIDTDRLPTYQHAYGDGRVVTAKLYPNSLLADFRKHFHEVWLPKRAKKYFEERDMKAVAYLPKLLEMRKVKELPLTDIE